jgi:hypothetical protein
VDEYPVCVGYKCGISDPTVRKRVTFCGDVCRCEDDEYVCDKCAETLCVPASDDTENG